MHFNLILPNPNSYLNVPYGPYLPKLSFLSYVFLPKAPLLLVSVQTATAAKPPPPILLCAYVQTYASWATTFLLFSPYSGAHAWAI